MARTRKKFTPRPEFGQRLVGLRKGAGLTQQDLADALGISRRMMAYYEGDAKRPPVALLPDLARILGTSIEELVGVRTRSSPEARLADSRLLRRLRAIERLPAKERRQIVQFIDAFLERDRVRNGTNG